MEELELTKLDILSENHPYVKDFFFSLGLKEVTGNLTATQLISELTDDFVEDCGLDRVQMLRHFTMFIHKMNDLKTAPQKLVSSLSIIGGFNKSGEKEDISLTLKPGDIVSVVGPTGSGKSRLLADIECLAQKDTPTGRQILLNGIVPDKEKRFSIEHKLVAQLSQNMNFVVDLTVSEFISMHAESRMITGAEEQVNKIIEHANELSGESFDMNTPLTQLSGGQSRALMIADTALLSPLPVVVIDEIENAGIDRKRALELLVREEKIVLISTHDPILALMGDRRIVIRNGGIDNIIETSEKERKNFKKIQMLDEYLAKLRDKIRIGNKIEFFINEYICGDDTP